MSLIFRVAIQPYSFILFAPAPLTTDPKRLPASCMGSYRALPEHVCSMLRRVELGVGFSGPMQIERTSDRRH